MRPKFTPHALAELKAEIAEVIADHTDDEAISAICLALADKFVRLSDYKIKARADAFLDGLKLAVEIARQHRN